MDEGAYAKVAIVCKINAVLRCFESEKEVLLFASTSHGITALKSVDQSQVATGVPTWNVFQPQLPSLSVG
jgi:hypothetical protein